MNRKHELFLINLGLETLLERVSSKPKVTVVKNRKAKWSKAQHKKYAETMAKKWGDKKKP
jgi:hypothetical protein